MLNLWDRIEIAVAVARGNAQYNREMRRGGRAAGTIISSKERNSSIENNSVDNTAATTTTTSASVDNNEQKKNTAAPYNRAAKKKAEQVKKAEAECPAEEPGAEKIKPKSKTVEGNTEAAMSSKMHVPDSDPSVIDMSAFGIQIDMDKMSGSSQPVNVAANPVITPQQQWAINQQNQMAQAAQSHIQQNNTYMSHLEQVGNGRHQVDQPKQTKVKPPKANADDVNIDIPTMKMDINPPPVKEVPEAISNPILQAEPIEKKVDPVFNNSALIAKFDYLKDIETIALECGVQVQFIERQDKLITCVVYTGPNPSPDKGFAIDNGNIIDRRCKIFPGILQFYEGCQAYPLFILNSKDKANSKKSKNVLNVELLKGLFIGGNDYPNDRDGMYRPEYRELNKYIALITIPTKDISNDERKSIQNRLVEIYRGGFFDKIYVPGSRFRIVSYDKKTGDIIISNEGVPANYGGPLFPVPAMSFTIEKSRVVRN